MKIGSNDSYYKLTLQSGLIELEIRLPAEVISHEPDVLPPTTSTTQKAFQWYQSARAGHLTVSEMVSSFPCFDSRLDDGQIHDLILERTSDQIRVTIDGNLVYFQQLSFDTIRAGFLEIQRMILGSMPSSLQTDNWFNGQIIHAVLQVDDTPINILEVAEKSLHGFEFTGKMPMDCTSRAVLSPSISMRHIFLLLRFPSNQRQNHPPPLFDRLSNYSKRVSSWQELEIDYESLSNDGFLFLIFHNISNASSPLLGAEIRNKVPYLVTEKQTLEIKKRNISSLRLGIGKISISRHHTARIIAIGSEPIEYFVAIDENELRYAFEAEIVGILESVVEEEENKLHYGDNILLGGSNWTTELELGRGLNKFWSGLGRMKDFSGCIKRLVLNGEIVDFEPIVNSRLRHQPLRGGQLLQLGCKSADGRDCSCKNGGICEDGECDCLKTDFTGAQCQIPASILDFNAKRQLRMRFPLAHQLESIEIQFAFKTKMRNTTLLSTYSQSIYSPRSHTFGVIHPDGMCVYLTEGLLVVDVTLNGEVNTLKVPFQSADGNWHALKILRTGSLLRIHLDSAIYEKSILEDENSNLQWQSGDEMTVFVYLGGENEDFQEEALDAENILMRIQEVNVGQVKSMSRAAFVGQIRNFKFTGIDPLTDPQYLVETPMLKWLSVPSEIQVKHAITLKTPECFLRLPRLNIYGAFWLSFAIKTKQENGIVLFNSGEGDFILIEIVNTQLTISFDMGHGAALQFQRIGQGRLSDGRWHRITISRNGQMDDYLRIKIKSAFGEEEEHSITIPSVNTPRNFDFSDPLYIGGIPSNVKFKFSERIISKYGIQGCVGSLKINNRTELDMQKIAESVMGENRTNAFCKSQVVQGCHDRPFEAPICAEYERKNRLPYCLNGGVCLHFWTSLRCACEMTTFTGTRCHLAGTSLKFGKNSSEGVGDPIFVKFTYLRYQQSTNRDEIALGLQVDSPFTSSLYTLLYIDSKEDSTDFLHIYLNDGIASLDFDLGGGLIQLKETRKLLNDGNYHRIRVFRHGLSTLLEVDNLITKHISEGIQGEQFNNQKSIWLGYAPATGNTTSPFLGVLSGVFYNGLLLCDLASGLSQREDVQVTRHPATQYLANFQIQLGANPYFRQLPNSNSKGPEANSYHDEDSSMNNIGNLIPPLPASPKPSPITAGTKSQFIKEWTHFPPGEQASEIVTDESTILYQGHVNTWLFVCFGAAGLALVASLIFFAFHCCQRRHQVQEHSTDQYQQADHRLSEYAICATGNIKSMQVN
nr:neurexin 1 alpha [Hymenolepis microstoma]